MASTRCWKCLPRPKGQLSSPSILNVLPATATAPFSTTSRSLAAPKQAKSAVKTVKGSSKSFAMKKKAVPVKTGKPPMPGERKAMRKRIVLSNTNALQVDGLNDLSKDMDLAVHTGKVVGIPGEVVDSLRAVEAFKVSQGWGMFRRPALLIREESVFVTEAMKRAEEEKAGMNLVIDGERGAGKSLMLLHAMATALVRGWVVLNIPEAQEITNAGTDYSPIPNTNPTLYSQNTYTGNWLSQILKANNKILQSLEMDPKSHNLPIAIQGKITLARLCELGVRDPDVSWPIFQALWTELTADGRPPVLLALDGLSYIMQNSGYRSKDFKEVHAHDLAIVKHFTEYLGGKKSFPNGGAVIAATSRSHAPISKSMDWMIKQEQGKHIIQMGAQMGVGQIDAPGNSATSESRSEVVGPEPQNHIGGRGGVDGSTMIAGVPSKAQSLGKEEQLAKKKAARTESVKEYFKRRKAEGAQAVELQYKLSLLHRDPFERNYDARAEESMQGASVLSLGGLSKDEARGLMEYWAQSGVLRQTIDERSVAEKWALAGNGIVGEIERGALRMRI